MSAVSRLVRAHLDLDGDGWLASFADLDLLVIALDAGAINISYCWIWELRRNLHSTDTNDFFEAGNWVLFHCCDGSMHPEIPLDYIYAHNDRASLVEYRDRGEDTGEDGQKFGLLLLLLSND